MRLSLHHRIVLPFAAVAIIATLAVAFVAYRVTSTTITARLRAEMANATTVASRSSLALNPGILAAVKQTTGSEVMTFNTAGILLTTVDEPARESTAARVMAAIEGRAIAPDAEPIVLHLRGEPPMYAAYRAVEGQPGTVIALFKDISDVERANETLRSTIIGAAIVSLIVMIGAGQFVARKVTAPIGRLAAFAERVSVTHTNERAPMGDDEVGRLAASFNGMLDRLADAQSAAVKAEKLGLAGLMAARVAHDVRNPLSSIKMQTQLLQSSLPPGSEGRDMTDAMLVDISQVEMVVGGLLEVAKPPQLRRAPRQVNELIDTVIRQVTPVCRHRKIDIEKHLDPTLPLADIDADRLTHALLNVVVNATEALREGGTLSVTSGQDAGDIVIVVDDDGVGIDAAAAATVFDPFVTTKPGGMGLGLVNARATIESHGGTITLAPRQPAGTRARIRLPVRPPAATANG